MNNEGIKTEDITRKRFEGLRVLVTGGTSGLGFALVQQFRQLGSNVAFVARTAERVATVAAETGSHPIVADVGRKEDIYPIALQAIGELGGLDVLINNASDLGPVPLSLLADTECEDFERALNVNVLGPFRLTKAVLGSLSSSARERTGGIIVNISSDAAVNPYPHWGAYGASKAAMLHMTRIWNVELESEGLRFIGIDPGDMDTPMHAQADPDADPSQLKRPEAAAIEIIGAIGNALAELEEEIIVLGAK